MDWWLVLLLFDIFLLTQIIGIIVWIFREIDKDIEEKANIIMSLKKLEFGRWVQEWGEETLKDAIREIVREELKWELKRRGL